VGVVLVIYRIAVPPGQGNFVHPAWGIYLALVSALVMLAGGVLAGQAPDEEPARAMPMPNSYTPAPHTDPFAPAAHADPFMGPSTGSVPPPAA
jgi:hypothetical protein